MDHLDHETIKSLVRGYFQRLLNKSEETVLLLPQDRQIDVDHEIDLMLADLGLLKQALPKRAYDGVTRAMMREATQQLGNDTKIAPETTDLLCHGILRARIEDYRILIAKLRGDYDQTPPVDPMFKDMEATGLPPIPGETHAPDQTSLVRLSETYCEVKRAEWGTKTFADNRRVLNLFIEVVENDKPITSLTVNDIRTYRDALMRIPPNYMKAKQNFGKPLKVILAEAESTAVLSPKTAQKYFENLKAFLNWCEREEYIKAVPGKAIKLPGLPKSHASEARLPFNQHQLETIFCSPLYMGQASPVRRKQSGDIVTIDGKYWVPLIGLFSGLRLGEIVQLLITDIKERDGITFFDINRGEHEEDKQIKTESSKREVPIHSMLLEFGLLGYIEKQRTLNPKGRIFSDIRRGSDGYYSHNFSKWFSLYISGVGAKSKKTSFHSFRHNVKDALVNAGVEEDRRKALMGHSDDSTHSDYGTKKLPIKILKGIVDKISYPVNFSQVLDRKSE